MARQMAYKHIRNALTIVETLISREDLDREVRLSLMQARRELYMAQDEFVWVKSRSRELAYVVSELIDTLGVEVKIGRPTVGLHKEDILRKISESIYLEASIEPEDGKVKVEKIAAIRK